MITYYTIGIDFGTDSVRTILVNTAKGKELLSNVSDAIVANVKAISVASTGSTPIAVNEIGVPLSLIQGFEENPNAMFILWKDHTAIKEANEINQLAHSKKYADYTTYVGGEY